LLLGVVAVDIAKDLMAALVVAEQVDSVLLRAYLLLLEQRIQSLLVLGVTVRLLRLMAQTVVIQFLVVLHLLAVAEVVQGPLVLLLLELLVAQAAVVGTVRVLRLLQQVKVVLEALAIITAAAAAAVQVRLVGIMAAQAAQAQPLLLQEHP
jgi:hypothetical protein